MYYMMPSFMVGFARELHPFNAHCKESIKYLPTGISLNIPYNCIAYLGRQF